MYQGGVVPYGCQIGTRMTMVMAMAMVMTGIELVVVLLIGVDTDESTLGYVCLMRIYVAGGMVSPDYLIVSS